MNAIVLAILVMVGLSLARVSVVFALIAAAVVGGLYAGLPATEIVSAFNAGLGGGAPVALAYATLGAFAVMLSRSGITQGLSRRVIDSFETGKHHHTHAKWVTWGLFVTLILAGFASGTIIPVHIAFIPILVPPLLLVMNHLRLDRRAVACAITFSITVMYMTTPIGFGTIFLNDILMGNINASGAALGLEISRDMPPKAMLLPAAGMCIGLLLAIFVSYRRKRGYQDLPIDGFQKDGAPDESGLKPWQLATIVLALVLALVVQLWSGSMIFGGLCGFAVLSFSGIVKWSEQDSVFTQGMRLMAMVGFIMIAAAGFAGVMQATGEIPALVQGSVDLIGDNRAMAALVMLMVGLFITMGIGSSFSTIPIIAAIYVPMCLSFGFSPLATVALIGTAAALGDAGSPASDSTLGPTAGLNADGQHDHIWDTVVPTFLHFNIPLVAFGWLAAMTL
ncbi:SLC13 family permease [Halomonas pacifica]|uniref:TRAP transporter large permease subunit n=1 Tax=Bisbaumannia pacifica TaxID=77098 RepID=A0ABD4L5I5_9GAMM|nr:Na+/H+ antiporter NhaC family protein [Halomonas pacifica]MBH8581970.1 TRAP transporter large permease subunit [Halomonas pacifica]MDC8804023.1 SLC13 family permease [Halomonas pacifica]